MALFNSTAPCPYCYTLINPDKVAFRCSGHHAPGKPSCQDKVDPARETHFKDTEPCMPVISLQGRPVLAKSNATCSACGGPSRVRVCPECHSLLPADFSSGSLLFGLVGVRDSGKTVMLSVLNHELQGTVSSRFDVSVDPAGSRAGLARDLATHRNIMLSEGGRLPRQTEERRKKQPAVFQWVATTKSIGGLVSSRKPALFSFYDNAGEDFATPDRALSQVYLGATSGIILLLDPFAFPANRERANEKGVELRETSTADVLDALTLVLRTANKVKRNKKIKQPIAVVISKIDAFFDQIPADHPLRRPSAQQPVFRESEAQTVHDHVGSMIEQWGGDSLIRKLEQNYTTFRLFGASALGAEPEYSSGRVNSRGVLPHRVAEPLLWLLSRHNIIPKGD